MPMVKSLISAALAASPDWQRSIRILTYHIIHNALPIAPDVKLLLRDVRCSVINIVITMLF